MSRKGCSGLYIKLQINPVIVSPLRRVKHVCSVNWHDMNIVSPKIKAYFSVPVTLTLFFEAHIGKDFHH